MYIAARSSSRCAEAIQKIKIETQSQKSGGKDSKKGGVGNNGKLEPMVIDLADLGTVKGAVEGFLAKEGRLDVLFHNAGVMTPPTGSKSKNVSLTSPAFLFFRALNEALREEEK